MWIKRILSKIRKPKAASPKTPKRLKRSPEVKNIVLKAKRGYVYAVKGNHYIFGKNIHIGANDSVDRWELIKESEAKVQEVD